MSFQSLVGARISLASISGMFDSTMSRFTPILPERIKQTAAVLYLPGQSIQDLVCQKKKERARGRMNESPTRYVSRAGDGQHMQLRG
jgi:hypothetical protein